MFFSCIDDEHCLFYINTNGEKIIWAPQELRENRIFDSNGSLIHKCQQSILYSEQVMFANIKKVVRLIKGKGKLTSFYEELVRISKENDLMTYIPGFQENTKKESIILTQCEQLAFIVFMYTVGSIENPLVINSFEKTSGLKVEKTLINTTVTLQPPKDPDFYSQHITDEETGKDIVVFPERIDNPDLRTLQDYSRILIKGPGGQGKSTFLYRLSQRAKSQNVFQNVIRIELAKLLSFSPDDLDKFGQPSACPIRHILAGLYMDDGSNNELINHLQDYKKTEKKDLLLLDGLNELYASSDLEKISVIKDELSYISKNWTNTIILITTRESEGEFSYKNCRFIDDYTSCKLSSVPKKLYNAFVKEHPDLDDKIKELAKIPLYFNTLKNLESTSKITSKYDLLLAIYKDRYKQTNQDYENFYAFFIIAPLLAREISNSNGNHISRAKIEELVNNYITCNFSLLSQACQKECEVAVPVTSVDSSKIVAILLSNSGPLNSESKDENLYKFFHDEIRDFVLSYGAYTSMQALKLGVNEEYRFVKDIYADFNFRDEPASLFKSRLGITKSCDLQETLGKFFDYTESIQITPAGILYAHTAFLISDYLSLGRSATAPVHNLLCNFSDNLVYLLNINVFDSVLEDLSEDDKIRCKYAVADIFSKHCEYYRINDKFKEGIELVKVSEKLSCDTDTLKNQKAKLSMLLYQQHIKTPDKVSVTPEYLGYTTYEELFAEGLRLQTEAADNNFNLSANLIMNLNSIPTPYLIENNVANVGFDFVKAFLTAYDVIFTRKRNNYVVREIEYTARQAVALLIKGYVKINPEMGYRTGYRLVEGQIVEGERNTLALSKETLALAEYILSFVEGTHLACMDYCRGIIAHYKNEIKNVQEHFEKERDYNLKTIFSYYKLGIPADIDTIYKDLKKAFREHEDSIDACHPIYWYVDIKNLELSCAPDRAEFFKEFEKEMPQVWKDIVKQLTL